MGPPHIALLSTPLPVCASSSLRAVPRDQNIPVTAVTEWVRDPQFVSEEWDQV